MTADDKRRFKKDGSRTAVEDPPELKFELVPRNEWVLIKEMRSGEQRTAGGIVKPGEDFFMNQGKSAKHTYAKILKLGPKAGSDLKEGDVVLVTKFSQDIEGAEEILKDTDLRLVRDEEIYCVVEPCI
jgi:co-chaperonin GroES (HSP10)